MVETAYRPLSRDTTPDAEAVQLDVFRRMTPRRKLQLMEDANRNAREMALAGLRLRHPDAGEEALFRRLMDLTLGEELAERAFGPLREGEQR